MRTERLLLLTGTIGVLIAAGGYLLSEINGPHDATDVEPAGVAIPVTDTRETGPSQATARVENRAFVPSQVRRLSGEERRRLGAQIEAALKHARVARSTSDNAPQPHDADAIIPLEEVAKPLQDALQQSIQREPVVVIGTF